MHNVLVGSVSFASPGKALHNASTAQEITVITESASNFQFKVRKSTSNTLSGPILIHPFSFFFPSTSDGAIRLLCQKVLSHRQWPSQRRHQHQHPHPGAAQVHGILKVQGEDQLLLNAVSVCLPNPKDDIFGPRL